MHVTTIKNRKRSFIAQCSHTLIAAALLLPGTLAARADDSPVMTPEAATLETAEPKTDETPTPSAQSTTPSTGQSTTLYGPAKKHLKPGEDEH